LKKPFKRLNSKLTTALKDNIAAQNASIAIGGGAYITYALLVALGLLLVTGILTSGGCSCSCRCATSTKVMKAADGWQKHAISLAR